MLLDIRVPQDPTLGSLLFGSLINTSCVNNQVYPFTIHIVNDASDDTSIAACVFVAPATCSASRFPVTDSFFLAIEPLPSNDKGTYIHADAQTHKEPSTRLRGSYIKSMTARIQLQKKSLVVKLGGLEPRRTDWRWTASRKVNMTLTQGK
jgi:hypothetical protein